MQSARVLSSNGCGPDTTVSGGRIVGVPVALLLLHDLRETYVTAHAAEIACVILGQAAKATRDAELVATAEQGLEEAERRWKWLRTKLKDASPQVLAAS
jgi:hypothetical protein